MFCIKNNIENDTWWIAPWTGDPGRTKISSSAKKYETERGAKIARGYYLKRYSHIRTMNLIVERINNV